MLKENHTHYTAGMRSRSTLFCAVFALLLCACASPPFAVRLQAQAAPAESPANAPKPVGKNYCTIKDGYDAIIVGAGLAGLSTAKELQHLGRKVLVLEANDRIGGRGYVGNIDGAAIDYGGAWIHGVPTNPLTAQVDLLGFTRIRTELDVPYYTDGKGTTPTGPSTPAGQPPSTYHRATKEEKELYDEAVEEFEKAMGAAAAAEQSQHALAEYACSAAGKIKKNELTPVEACGELLRAMPDNISVKLACIAPHEASLKSLCTVAEAPQPVTDDANAYTPKNERFAAVIPMLVANSGPLESAAELKNSSAVDSTDFESGEDDLIDQGMGAFVAKFGANVKNYVCTKSPVTNIKYSSKGVEVTASGKTFIGKNAVVTVSVGVLQKGKIAFDPVLPDWKTKAINQLTMGNMQKVIIPFSDDIFHNDKSEKPNSWVIYEGELPQSALDLAKQQRLPLLGKDRLVMAFVIKPLDKNVAIGFFGGDWAKALEQLCEGKVSGSGKKSACDSVAIDITKAGLSNIYGAQSIADHILEKDIEVTHWSLDPTSYGAYSIAEPGKWIYHEKLGEAVKDESCTKRLFFAGEGTARGIYIGSYPGAYESGVKAAREINAEMLKSEENAKENKSNSCDEP
jgi:monoamine oxidase